MSIYGIHDTGRGFVRSDTILAELERVGQGESRAAMRIRDMHSRGITYTFEDFDILSLALRTIDRFCPRRRRQPDQHAGYQGRESGAWMPAGSMR